MTLNQIRTMFQPGQTWQCVNDYNPKANGPRIVAAVYPSKIQWNVNGQIWATPIPQASQVIEARDGFFQYRLFLPKDVNPIQNNRTLQHSITMTRIDAPHEVTLKEFDIKLTKEQALKIQAEQIAWYNRNGDRPWLAATMAALTTADQLEDGKPYPVLIINEHIPRGGSIEYAIKMHDAI